MKTSRLKYSVLLKRGKVKKKLYIWYNFIIIIQDMDQRTEPEKREVGAFKKWIRGVQQSLRFLPD